jgi:hypothetical protein
MMEVPRAYKRGLSSTARAKKTIVMVIIRKRRRCRRRYRWRVERDFRRNEREEEAIPTGGARGTEHGVIYIYIVAGFWGPFVMMRGEVL